MNEVSVLVVGKRAAVRRSVALDGESQLQKCRSAQRCGQEDRTVRVDCCWRRKQQNGTCKGPVVCVCAHQQVSVMYCFLLFTPSPPVGTLGLFPVTAVGRETGIARCGGCVPGADDAV